MSQRALSQDTEVVLLLCGRFGGERQELHQPLSAREYGELAKWLVAHGLRPADLLTDAGRSQLPDVQDIRLERKRVEFLLERGTALALALERWGRGGLWVISRGDPEFPKRLRRYLRHATPPLLYGAGDKSLLDVGGLAIIGSRDASDEALDYTRTLADKCAQEGLGVVSGGARGVDAAAMRGATEGGGVVIGVLASELLKSSVNRQNRTGLQDGRLVLVSPFYPEAGFNAGNAMARNKYIYTLADQALVVDSALLSGGTWAGAVEDLQSRWVPLYVRMPGQGAGNLALVQEGGRPFTFSVDSTQSLREYLAQMGSVWPEVAAEDQQPSLLEAREPDAAVLAARDVGVTGVVAELPAEVPPTVEGEKSVHAAGAVDLQPSLLDMFDDFLSKLALVLTEGTKNEEEVAAALCIEKGQAKVWLKRATDAEHVERLKKPVRYALRKQAPLC